MVEVGGGRGQGVWGGGGIGGRGQGWWGRGGQGVGVVGGGWGSGRLRVWVVGVRG